MYGPAGPVPDGIVDGCYVNYPDVDLDDWQHLYYQADFNHKQSIELPA